MEQLKENMSRSCQSHSAYNFFIPEYLSIYTC